MGDMFMLMVKPNLTSQVQLKEKQQKSAHDLHAKERRFQVGDTVFARNFPVTGVPIWVSGQIIAAHGPLSYLIELEDSRHIHRHVDHIHSRVSSPISTSDDLVDIPVPMST